MNLLIVDDEKREIAVIQRLLEKVNIRLEKVYEARSMKEAEEIIKKSSILIMLCDIEMPGGTGLELARWVRDYDKEIQIIYLTGHADFPYVRTALQIGAVDYLLKPVEEKSLENALKKAAARLPEGEKFLQHMDAEAIVGEVKKYVQCHCDREINRKELASRYYIHPDYLSHIFKNRLGVSLSEYVIQVRMAKAKKLLEKTNLPINKVAIACGYSNTAFFAKHFRRLMEVSPKEYRNIVKEGNSER